MSNSKKEISIKRSVLLSARVRFSPTGANIREEAVQRILEQNLAAAGSTTGLTEEDLRKVLDLGGNIPILRTSDVRSGIEHLKSHNRIVEIKKNGKINYSLSPAAKAETEVIIKESEEYYESTLNELFKSAPGGISDYKTAFLKLLCLVFSRLGDVYIKVIAGIHAKESFTEHQLLSRSMTEVLRSESVPDKEAFKYAVNRFFREASPKFDHIKWNMAQSYYITKALGIDEAAQMLSADILYGSSFYLDTNVLIAGLSPEHRHHSGFQELFNACKALNIKLKVAQITLEELNNSFITHLEQLRKVLGKIPNATRSKVSDFLLEYYLVSMTENPKLSLEEFLSHVRQQIKTLQEVFNFELIDDQWFDKERNTKATEDLARKLSLKHEKLRNRPKNKYLALHDALLIRWVLQENEFSKGKCWAVTLDLSLVDNAISKKNTYEHPIVITLDALLQWTTPLCGSIANEERLAEMYSRAIKYQILPREIFFDLRDFQIFVDMDIETSQLPAEDVESCIQEIRKIGPTLDISKAEDREKMGRTIQRYFADPGTKYRKELETLVEQNQELRDGRTRAEQRISQLEGAIERLELKERRRKLVHSVVARAIGLFLVLLILWAGVVKAAIKWGSGDTIFQKLTNSAWWFVAMLGLIGFIFPFVLGRDRLRVLRWWKGEDDGIEAKGEK